MKAWDDCSTIRKILKCGFISSCLRVNSRFLSSSQQYSKYAKKRSANYENNVGSEKHGREIGSYLDITSAREIPQFMLNTCKHPGSSFKGSKGWPANLAFCNMGCITSHQKSLWASSMEGMLEKSWVEVIWKKYSEKEIY